MTPRQQLETLYHQMLTLADAHITLDAEPHLDGGLTPRDREYVNLGVDIGWTATLEELTDRGLLAGGNT
jgi:hypothetical protein